MHGNVLMAYLRAYARTLKMLLRFHSAHHFIQIRLYYLLISMILGSYQQLFKII